MRSPAIAAIRRSSTVVACLGRTPSPFVIVPIILPARRGSKFSRGLGRDVRDEHVAGLVHGRGEPTTD